jgi:hypothetical protein
VFVAAGFRPEIRALRADGTLERIIRWNAAPTPLTDEVMTRLVRMSMPTGTAEDRVQSIVARALATPRPAVMPAYARVKVDGAGRIWVEDYNIRPDLTVRHPADWTVFDPSGQPLGRVVLPAVGGVATIGPTPADPATPRNRHIDLGSIGRDELVLTWRDDQLGFPHLTLHALEAVP